MKNVVAFLMLVLVTLSSVPGCTRWTCQGQNEVHWENFSYVAEEAFRYHSNEFGDFDIIILYQHEDTIGAIDHYRIGEAMEEVIEHYLDFGGFDPDGPLPVTILVGDRGLTNDICHSEGDSIVGCSCGDGGLFPAARDFEHQMIVWDGFWIDDFQGPLTIQHELIHILQWMDGITGVDHVPTELWDGYW